MKKKLKRSTATFANKSTFVLHFCIFRGYNVSDSGEYILFNCWTNLSIGKQNNSTMFDGIEFFMWYFNILLFYNVKKHKAFNKNNIFFYRFSGCFKTDLVDQVGNSQLLLLVLIRFFFSLCNGGSTIYIKYGVVICHLG